MATVLEIVHGVRGLLEVDQLLIVVLRFPILNQCLLNCGQRGKWSRVSWTSMTSRPRVTDVSVQRFLNYQANQGVYICTGGGGQTFFCSADHERDCVRVQPINQCCCCCFSHSAHWLPRKLLYTVANPARGLLNRGKKKEKKTL